MGQHLGETAIKTSKIINEVLDGEAYALSSVLFIDTGYSGGDAFGKEALRVLLERAEDDRHRLVVVLAGYPDGNGRMSRSLQTLMIAREGELAPEFSSIEAWLGRPGNTWEYYRELQRRGATYRPAQDVSDWVRFNLTAYHQQAQTVRSRLDRSSRVWLLLGEFAEVRGLEERVVSALHDVAMSGRVRRTRYERAEDLSLQRAQRDLRDLVRLAF